MRHFSFLLLMATCFFALPFVTLAQSELEKAEKQYELRSFREAAASYVKVVTAQPTNSVALSRLGDCYFYIGDLAKAESTYAKAVAAPKPVPAASLMYGRVLMMLERYDDAKTQFTNYSKTNAALGKHYVTYATKAIDISKQKAVYKVVPAALNTPSADFGPAFLSDALVFSSARTDMTRKVNNNGSGWNGQANQVFKASINTDGNTGKVAFLKSDLQNTFNEGPVSLSSDGKFAVFCKNNFVDGISVVPTSTSDLSIFFAGVTPDGSWSNARSFAHNSSSFANTFPCLSPDGKALYFSSNRPDGIGGFDLYVSYKKGESWSYPENLGPDVNTEGDEITPFMEDNTLYFSSNYHFGLGGFDCFKAVKTGELWDKISNLGPGFNSSRDDYGLIHNKAHDRFYWVSNRVGGKGNEDIYIATKPNISVSIQVVAEDGKAIAAATISGECFPKPMGTNAEGLFQTTLKPAQVCKVKVDKSGYEAQTINLEADNTKAKVVLKKAGSTYKGTIVSFEGKKAIKSALIIASIGKEKKAETISNERGEFSLPLATGKTYTLLFSAVGHKDQTKEVEATGKVEGTNLGVIEMMLPYAPTKEIPKPTPPAVVVVPPAPIKTNETGKGDKSDTVAVKPLVIQAYAIQLRSQALEASTDLSEFDSLKSYGNLYTVAENGSTKIRIGLFATRDQATIAQKKIQNKGFKGAYTTPESNPDILKKYKPKDTTKPKGEEPMPTGYNQGSIKPAEASKEPKQSYSIRIGAFTKAASIQTAALSKIGKVQQAKSGKFTVVTLDGFITQKAADEALAAAKKLGYNDAIIVSH